MTSSVYSNGFSYQRKTDSTVGRPRKWCGVCNALLESGTCPECGSDYGRIAVAIPACPECDGKGWTWSPATGCDFCSGRGRVSMIRWQQYSTMIPGGRK